MVPVAVIILRTGRAQSRRLSLPIFAGLNDSVRSKRPIDTPVLHEHRGLISRFAFFPYHRGDTLLVRGSCGDNWRIASCTHRST